MKQVLGKKQSSRNEDFVNAWNNIEQLVSREEAERLVASAVSEWLRGGHRRMARASMGRLSSERLARALGHQPINGA